MCKIFNFVLFLINRKKQCPQCRKQIGCKRLFRNDFRLSAIINGLIPDIDQYNKFEGVSREQEVTQIYDFDLEKKRFKKKQQEQQRKAELADKIQAQQNLVAKTISHASSHRPRGRPRGVNYPTASNKRKSKRKISSSEESEGQ